MDILALILSIIGTINWGLVGIFDFDLVVWLFCAGSFLTRALYIIIALAGLWCISFFFRRSRLCCTEE